MMKATLISLFLFANICFAGDYLIDWSGTRKIYFDESSQNNVENLTNGYIQVSAEGYLHYISNEEFADFIRTNNLDKLKCPRGPNGMNVMDCPRGPDGLSGLDCSSIRFTTNYDFNNLELIEPAEDLSNAVELLKKDIVTFTSYNATNFFANPSNISLVLPKFSMPSDITWYIKDFRGEVYVDFIVEEYGLSQSTKRALEQEISEAIQKIIDLHFPPD